MKQNKTINEQIEELKKEMCKIFPDYPDISSVEFFRLIEICFEKGKQEAQKMFLEEIDKVINRISKEEKSVHNGYTLYELKQLKLIIGARE